jgi:uncharacterized Zn-finger protein
VAGNKRAKESIRRLIYADHLKFECEDGEKKYGFAFPRAFLEVGLIGKSTE